MTIHTTERPFHRPFIHFSTFAYRHSHHHHQYFLFSFLLFFIVIDMLRFCSFLDTKYPVCPFQTRDGFIVVVVVIVLFVCHYKKKQQPMPIIPSFASEFIYENENENEKDDGDDDECYDDVLYHCHLFNVIVIIFTSDTKQAVNQPIITTTLRSQ